MQATTRSENGVQPEAARLVLEAAGATGLLSSELLSTAPDTFRDITAASGALMRMWEIGECARSSTRTKLGFRYWTMRHAPAGANFNRTQEVRPRAAAAPPAPALQLVAQPAAPAPRPVEHAASKIRVRSFIELDVHGKTITIDETEALEILNTLLTIFPNHRRI